MKRGIKKKGLSPVVASILLIFLVLVLAAIVFLWARGFFSEQLEKGGESIENKCRSVSFRAEVAQRPGADPRKIFLDISNTGNVGVHAINIREGRRGQYITSTHAINLDSGHATTLEVDLQHDIYLDQDAEIIIYPVLLGTVVGGNENKEFTCLDNAERILIRAVSN